MLIKPEIQKFAKIKVVGIGGGGSNALQTMMDIHNIQGVEFIAINTDAQHLGLNSAPTKIQIGKALTHGLGVGGDPILGAKAAAESVEDLKGQLSSADLIFITAGMGGGTGSGASPIIAELAKSLGALTVGVVTKPFDFEGHRRRLNAEEAIGNLKEKVDTLITIPNQRLLEIGERNISLLEAFKLADSVLGDSVKGIAEIITVPGLINRDFADVRAVMKNAGSALMGIGKASGEDRAVLAARQAIESPLLEASADGAKGVLFNITGGRDLKLSEVDAAANLIAGAVDPDANIIFGATIDDSISEVLRITVIATGFDESVRHLKAAEKALEKKPSVKQELPPAEEFDLPAFLRRR